MNYIDIFLLVIAGLAAFKGYSKGLVVEFFSFLAFILGLFLSFKYSRQLVTNFFGESEQKELWVLAAFILMFVGLSLLIRALGVLVKKSLRLVFLGWLDNVLGAAFGLLKWGFIVSLLIWILLESPLPMPEHDLQNSWMFPYVQPIASTTLRLLEIVFPFLRNIIDSVDSFGEYEEFTFLMKQRNGWI